MIGIITGDIVNSRLVKTDTWLKSLKSALEAISPEQAWEIYRGDSFQIEIQPQEALRVAIYLKSSIKTIKSLDVRLAIGIGEKDFTAPKLSESNGEAFVNSGEKLDSLKDEGITMAVKTPWQELNDEINVVLRLALIIMDNWSPISAELVKLSIENPGISQKELAERTKKSQSSVSEALKRARYLEISAMEELYRQKIKHHIHA